VQWIMCHETNSAKRRGYIFLVDATDGITPELGEAGGQPQISKNGAGFVNTGGTLVSVGNGAYYVQFQQSEVSDRGWLLLRYKSVNTAEFQSLIHIIAQTRFGDRML